MISESGWSDFAKARAALERVVYEALAYRAEHGVTASVEARLSPAVAQMIRKEYRPVDVEEFLAGVPVTIPTLHPDPADGLFTLAADGAEAVTVFEPVTV